MLSREPVRLTWDLRSPAPVARVWELLSDTDRFNRVAELGFRFEAGRPPIGRLSALGMEHAWDELPWEYEAPRGYRATRLFHGGPVERIQIELALATDGEGTRVHYEVAIHPRVAVLRPVVAAQAAATTRPRLDRALRSALALLAGDEVRYDPAPPALDPAAARALDAALTPLPSPAAQALAVLLRDAPLREQDRLRPLALARAWGLPSDEVVATCLAAVRAGALELRWELLCPRCRAPKAALAALGPATVHCDTCDISYDSSFAENVEVTFRPAPAIRQFSLPIECLMSPARTPHVVARAQGRPGKVLEWALDLPDGAYRLRMGEATARVEVGVPGAPTAATLDVGPDGIRPAAVRLGPGEVCLALRCRVAGELVLERRRRALDVLTAGALLESARDLLPAGALRPGLDVKVHAGAVVAVDPAHPDARPALAGARLFEGNGLLLAVHPSAEAALEAADALAGDARWACGVEAGPIVWVDGNPAGATFEGALAAVRRSGPGRVVFGQAVRQAPPPRYPTPSDDVPAEIAGRRLGALLGEGSFGRVYAADGDVVVKVLRPEHATDLERVQRFFHEGRLLAGLDHPKIVRVYDWGSTAEGLLYLVLERLDGEELAALLVAEGRLLPARAARLVGDVLDALAEAHRRGIVHRDIKPQNVIVCRGADCEEVAKVLDFGVARDMSAAPDPSEAGLIVGTPNYLAPEQVQARPDLDGRVDVYAAGIVLYECVSGRLPFTGKNALAIAMRRLAVPPAPLGDDVPTALRDVVDRALALERDERWPDATQMRSALAGWER